MGTFSAITGRDEWAHDALRYLSEYPGFYWPAKAMNKVVAAGGVLPLSALTPAERKRIEKRFVVRQGRGRPLIPYTRREHGRIEITARGWKELQRIADARPYIGRDGLDSRPREA